MRAVGYREPGPIDRPDALLDLDVAEPRPGARDLLVAVEAVSVNPVDTKVRASARPDGGPRILGYDAAGTVVATGEAVTLFRPGDRVFYAGAIDRQGTNAERHVVDERIVGRAPASHSAEEAAALPLTAITAWEILFDGFRLAEGEGAGEAILVVGGAGGVGSILIQLARALTGLTVVATASRPETRDWVRQMGAHHVIDHREALAPQLATLGIAPRWVAGLTGSAEHFPALAAVAAPRGHIALIESTGPIDARLLRDKSLTLTWEYMFTRPTLRTADMIAQHHLLTRLAGLLDAGTVRTTLTTPLGPLSAATLAEAHRLQESGRAIGKTVLSVG